MNIQLSQQAQNVDSTNEKYRQTIQNGANYLKDKVATLTTLKEQINNKNILPDLSQITEELTASEFSNIATKQLLNAIEKANDFVIKLQNLDMNSGNTSEIISATLKEANYIIEDLMQYTMASDSVTTMNKSLGNGSSISVTSHSAIQSWNSEFENLGNASVLVLALNATLSVISTIYDTISVVEKLSDLYNDILSNFNDFMSFLSTLQSTYNQIIAQQNAAAEKDSDDGTVSKNDISWTEDDFDTYANSASEDQDWDCTYDVTQQPGYPDPLTSYDELLLSLLPPEDLNNPNFSVSGYITAMGNSTVTYEGTSMPLSNAYKKMYNKNGGDLEATNKEFEEFMQSSPQNSLASTCYDQNKNKIQTSSYSADAFTIIYPASDIPTSLQPYCYQYTSSDGTIMYGINPNTLSNMLQSISCQVSFLIPSQNMYETYAEGNSLAQSSSESSAINGCSDIQSQINSLINSITSQISLLQQSISTMQTLWNQLLSLLQGIFSGLSA